MREYKPLTKGQIVYHEVLRGAVLGSPAIGVLTAAWIYFSGGLSTWATVWGMLVVAVPLIFWIDTEVNWRKREEMLRQAVARITKSV